jgi:signal transduction histidine kinase/Flp pilus assembly protein TadD
MCCQVFTIQIWVGLKKVVRLVLVCIFSFFGTGKSYGQMKSNLDSLIIASQSVDESARFGLFRTIANNYLDINVDSSLVYNRRAVALSKKLHLEKEEGESYFGLANAYNRGGLVDSALFYYDKAMALAKKTKNERVENRIRANRAALYFTQGKIDEALESYTQLLQILKLQKNDGLRAQILVNVGHIYKIKGEYNKALSIYFEVLNSNHELRMPLDQSRDQIEFSVLQNIGAVYSLTADTTKALEYFRKAYRVGKTNGYVTLLSFTASSIGIIHRQKKNYDSALFYFKEALALRDQSNTSLQNYATLCDISWVLFMMNRYKESEQYLAKAYDLTRKVNNSLAYAYTYLTDGELSFRKEDFANAVRKLQLSLQLAKENKLAAVANKAEEYLEKTYAAMGNYKQAYEFQKRYAAYQDSLLGNEKIRAITRLESKYAIEKQRKENEILTLESKLQKQEIKYRATERSIIIVCCFILFIASTLLLIGMLKIKGLNKKLHQQNHFIERQNEDIAKQNIELILQKEEIKSQKDALETKNIELATSREKISRNNTLLEEVVRVRTLELSRSNEQLQEQFHQLEQFSFITAHTLRGPVARILGLGNILSLSKPEENSQIIDKLISTTHDLDSIVHEIGQIVLVNEQTQQEIETIELLPFVEKVKASFLEELKTIGGNFTIRVDAPLAKSNPNYLNNILTNLISNSIKFRSPVIPLNIHLSIQADKGILTWTVKDNGVGFDSEKYSTKLFEPYQRFHHYLGGKGLGLYLAKSFVKNLRGTIELSSKEGEGTIVTFSLPYSF